MKWYEIIIMSIVILLSLTFLFLYFAGYFPIHIPIPIGPIRPILL